jgi:acyl dehydratase
MTAPLDLARLLAYAIPDVQDDYGPTDTILYALGTGAGLSHDVDELPFLFERALIALPTMALVLGARGFWPMDEGTGLDWFNILHGDQRLTLLRPLKVADRLTGRTRITAIADKGAGKPALIRAIRDIRDGSGALVAQAEETWVVRGAGGFGGKRNLPDDGPLGTIPDTAPDASINLPTSIGQASLYRLTGDRNPLHIDPAIAKQAGFDRPILHGLSTMGLVGRALIHGCCAGDPRRISSMHLRFTAPVLPGDTIRTDIWQDQDVLRFRATAMERNIMVIDGGEATLDRFA